MLVGFLAVVVAVVVVALAGWAFARWGSGSDDKEHGGTTSKHTGPVLAALFLMAFAIAVVVPWTTADAARQNTHAESEAIVGAYWAASELPAPVGPEVQAGLRGYVQFVVADEWDEMKRGHLDPVGWTRLLWLTALTGFTTILFPFIVGARPKGMTIIPLGVMAGLLGFGIWLTFDISHVFRAGLSVKPTAFTAAQQEFPRIPANR